MSMECNIQHEQEDLAERILTIGNPIEYRLDISKQTRTVADRNGPPAAAATPRNQLISGDNGANHHGYPSPSLSISYFLQTKHEKVVINCKDAGRALTKYSRVDVDVYVSPLCYDFKTQTPTVTFKHKPKNFHIKVLVPGNLPKPPDDRPPYGLGVEVSLESLSICHSTSPSPLRRSTRCSNSTTTMTTPTSPSMVPKQLAVNKKQPTATAKANTVNSNATEVVTRGQKRASKGSLTLHEVGHKRKCSRI